MTPTGRLLGTDLVLTRTFRAPIDDVWASISEPARTARWFGTWEGTGGAGQVIKVQLGLEEGTPWMEATVDACEAPRHLAITATDEMGTWRLDAKLTEVDGVTELVFTHRQVDPDEVGSVGPGWEYYLDALVASREDRPLPNFDDYYPAMKEYFDAQR